MKDKILERYGKMISGVRRKLGLSQRDLAKLADIPQSKISRLEAGEYNAGLKVSLRIEQALGLDKIYLNDNNIMMTDSNNELLVYTLGATNPEKFFEDIRNLPCFEQISLSDDKRIVSVLWDKNYKHEYFPEPLDELQYLISKNNIDWEMGSDDEHVTENYFWQDIDITDAESSDSTESYILSVGEGEFVD